MMIALTPRIPICRTAQYFNPHFRKGSDSYSHPHADFTNISIHTSAREVTKYGKKAIYHLDDFNPHFRKGSDQWGHTASDPIHYFNPHFRKGSDSVGRRVELLQAYFNPHFRKGSDNQYTEKSCWFCISIHTSAREVTVTAIMEINKCSISIHTSAREVTDFWFSVSDC